MHLDVSIRHTPWLLSMLLTVPLLMFTACTEGGSGDDDDAAADDDDAGDDDAGDDDMWADDDDAADDDAAGDDDDAASGDPCSVSFGPPEMPVDLSGTCEEEPGDCDGGYDPMDSQGSCASGLTCCIHDDQCETALGGTCVVSDDDCESEVPPGAPGFPVLGCSQDAPVCCLPEPPQ